MSKRILISLAVRFMLLLIASYGIIYYSYKYYIPWSGGNDFAEYYSMYQNPLDFSVAYAPFIYRQVSAVLTYIVYELGIYYPNVIWFNDPAYDQRIFFAALFTNYICLLLTAVIVGSIVEHELDEPGIAYPMLAGLACLLSFQSQLFVVTGLTEGVTWLMVALLLLVYLREGSRLAVAAALAFSIFQREMIPVMFAAMAFFSLLLGRGTRHYQLFVLGWAVLCFAAYIVVRKVILPVPGYEEQLTFTHLAQSVAAFRPNKEIVFQGLLVQNLLLLCLALSATLWAVARSVPRMLPILLLTFLVMAAVGLFEGIGNNIGRVAGIVTPAFAALAAATLRRIELALATHGDPTAAAGTRRLGG